MRTIHALRAGAPILVQQNTALLHQFSLKLFSDLLLSRVFPLSAHADTNVIASRTFPMGEPWTWSLNKPKELAIAILRQLLQQTEDISFDKGEDWLAVKEKIRTADGEKSSR